MVSVGLVAAWRANGKDVAPFKKGPDYIDAGWLALAAGRPCYNLDTFMMDSQQVRHSFFSNTESAGISVIEGNRGLFDGLDVEGRTSTAELAKLLDAPVVLCVDCTKMTRTTAAIVAGCNHFDADINLAGVILNRVAGPRHENIVRSSIEAYTDVAVLGAIPRLRKENFPERHMGLVPTFEHQWNRDSIDTAARVVADHVDLKRLEKIAAASPAFSGFYDNSAAPGNRRPQVRIGILKDSAFQFYYPDNLEALAAAGAELIYISPFETKSIPEIDALYIGGGFPETHAEQLAQNADFKSDLKRLAEAGLPIYAECGGLMYLGRALVLNETTYPMADVLPVTFGLATRPQGHGYTIVEVKRQNPYYEVGTLIKGHEFHYSYALSWEGDDTALAFELKRGTGFIDKKDGVCYKNVLATYTHIHALGTPAWAKALVANGIAYQKTIKKGQFRK